MEYGALVCTYQNPKCLSCIFQEKCYAFNQNKIHQLPVKKSKKTIRNRYLNYLVIKTPQGQYVLEKRKTNDIWPSLYQFPLIESNSELKEVHQLVSEMGSLESSITQGTIIEKWNQNLDEIKGILYIKDLLPHINEPNFNWQEVLRTPYYVPENKKLDDLLISFKKEKIHMAILVDEYGGTSGLITLEDILEQVVGDIQDEHDEKIKLQYKKIDETNYQFDAKINLMDFFKVIGAKRMSVFKTVIGDAESLGGLILEINKEFPLVGTEIEFKQYRFTIEKIVDNRISQVGISIPLH